MSVDIISMSFGFVKNHKVLEAAINDTNILMFAASTNFGAVEDSPIRFPARMKHKVICIHAADGIGDPSRGNPGSSSKQRNFSILGECVFIRNELDPASQKLLPVYESGTSVATPIAAGVATLVLEFSQQDGLHQKVEDKEALKSFAGMSAVLRRMSKAGRKSGFDFIEPSKVLDIGVGADEREQMGHVCAKISEALSGRYDWEE